VLEKDYNLAVGALNKIVRKYVTRLMVLSMLYYGFFRTFLMKGVFMLVLVYKVFVTKTIAYGSFLALFNGTWELKRQLDLVLSIIPRFVENSLYIEKFRSFMERECEQSTSSLHLPETPVAIEFKNVWFKYPQGGRYVLKDISFTIYPNERLGIYGFNGAGKTTIVKLLLRLYRVTAGEILLGGRSIYDYDLEEYRRYIGVLFQDFQIYAFGIGENVLMDEYRQQDYLKVIRALNNARLEYKLKELGYDITKTLSKEFDDGVELSGGEKQKIALARILVRDNPVIVLDEPSSALDPITEYEVNKSIHEFSKGRTTICISHRINTNILSDRVIFLKDGEIVRQFTVRDHKYTGGILHELFNN